MSLLVYFRLIPAFAVLTGIFLMPSDGNRIMKYEKPSSVKNVVTINKGWEFRYVPEADRVSFSDSAGSGTEWNEIAIPHTWSTYETTGHIHPFIKYPSEKDDPYWWTGKGLYRKSFHVSGSLAGRKIFAEFDGVMKNCEVYLNGRLVGDHKGGFTSFCLDLTDYIIPGEENTLALSVSNRRDDQYSTPPMGAGNWNLYGGIYRDVRIVVKEKLYIPFQGNWDHEGGTFVTTPVVNADEGIVNLRTWVRNEYPEKKECRLVSVITDPDGKMVERMEASYVIENAGTHEFNQTSRPVVRPRLWSPESPSLYSVFTELYIGRKLVDTYHTPLGFRWFSWNYERNRLILNGREIHIHGTNRHQEYPWLGDAVPKWIHESDLIDIRYNLNHNFIRTCHYTQDSYVYDWCDRNGLMVAEEVPNIKKFDFSEEIQARQLKEMIRRDRNHPSILFWSMGNETDDAADSRFAWEEDSTRIIHARHVDGESAGEFVTHTHQNMDMENLLRCTVRGWYNEDVRNLAPVNNQATGNEEHQHRMARVAGGSQRGIISMGNGVMWIYADHGADREYIDSPLKHINPKGWVDLYRQPKYIYYLWQANYSEKPMVFIHPHFWRKEFSGTKRNIVIDSNCDVVELFVNGKTMGKLYPAPGNFHTVTFENVPVEDGMIRAEGIINGVKAEHQVRMAGDPARIVLTASHISIEAAKNSVVIVKADITDAGGNYVYGANPPLKWNVEGAAKLSGPDLWTTDTSKDEEMEGTMYIDVPVCNVVRSDGNPGRITVSVSSPGLQTGTVVINSITRKEKNDKTGISDLYDGR